MRVLFAGTPAVALPALDAVAASHHELVGVLTRPDAPAGRGRRLTPSPVAARAEELGVPVLKPTSAKDPALLEQVRDLAPECCPVVAYGGLLPAPLLDAVPQGWVNLHFSLLPAWRGAAPVQHALWAGDEITGATTFRIVEALDAGPVLGVMTQAVGPDDTAGDLLDRLARGGAPLLVSTLDGLETGQLEARPQPPDGVSLAPKIEVADAEVDWTRPAVAIDRQVRACTPAPGAWTTLGGERIKLGPVRPVGRPRLEPGALEVAKNAVFVGTGSGPVQLGAVRAHGRKEMDAAAWARGARLPDGAVLGT